MQPSPKITLPLITASWQNTLFPPPARADSWPLAEWRPDVLPPPSPRADVRPDDSAAPRAEVRPVAPEDDDGSAPGYDDLVALFSSSGWSSGGNEIERPFGFDGFGDSELPSVMMKRD